MIFRLKYLYIFGIVTVFVLALGIPISRAADSQNFGAISVDQDLTIFQSGPNEFGDDSAYNSARSSTRDRDIGEIGRMDDSYGLGICGGSYDRCRRGADLGP